MFAQAVEALPADAPDRETLAKRAETAQASVKQLEQNQKTNAELQTQIAAAESTSKQLAGELQKLKDAPPKKLPADIVSLNQLAPLASETQVTITQLRAEISKLDARLVDTNQNRARVEKELIAIDGQLESANAAVEQTSKLGNSTVEKLAATEALINQLATQQRKLTLQLQQQLEAAEQQFDLVQKQRDLAAAQLKSQESFAKQIAEETNRLRQQEAMEQASEATEQATEMQKRFPLLATSEQTNVDLAADIADLEKESSSAATHNRELNRQLIDISNKFKDTQNRISAIGRSDTVGAMLRKRKSDLPSVVDRQQRAVSAHDRIEDIQFERFQISEGLAELSPDSIRLEIEETGAEFTSAQWAGLEEPVEKLISRRREALRAKDKILDRLFTTYIETETTNSRVATITGQFNEFINERILWLRSNKVLLSEFQIDRADKSLFAAESWTKLAKPATEAIQNRSWFFMLGGLLVAVLLAFRSTMRKRVDMFSESAARGSCTTFWPTGRAAILTILISITVPLLVYGIGLGFKGISTPGSRLLPALADALMTTGLFAIPFEVLRRICRHKGLATMHFDWPDVAVAKLKSNLVWYVVPASTLVFAVSLLIRIDSAHRVDLIERILFVAAMLLTGWLLFRIFSPATGIFSQYIKRNEHSWTTQTSSLWFTLILLIPISLTLFAVSGYYYTALNLTRCLCLTFGFVVGIELIRALVRRFVLIRRRAAHIESAKRKRQAEIEAIKEKAKRAAAERKRRIEAGEDVDDITTPVTTAESLAELQVEQVDIDENAGQANQLIHLLGWAGWLMALWLVWSDVLPAIKALDEFKLWGGANVAAVSSQADSANLLSPLPTVESDSSKDTTKSETGTSSENGSPNNATAAAANEGDLPATDQAPAKSGPLFVFDPPDDDGVSLRDFLVFLAIVILTFVAARNLPNAFEMLFLEDLPVDRSARFASKALFSYAIVILGTVLALRTLSINWTNVQWLVTALTFGLAFGLQEIFANFVAGIILMFERPMRIGDLITVDEFTGVVTRIRTRATTVVNWDRKEYVIPNKDFITGRLVNWTLSDAINRVQFTVGIAYGSDVAKAKKIIFDICQEHPSIVDEPATSITFEEFADSSLNLGVRTFLGEVSSRLAVVDALHSRINTEFNEAGIEIAFPQRDMNLRSVDANMLQTLAKAAEVSGKSQDAQ